MTPTMTSFGPDIPTRGIWHQYGDIPADDGIALEIKNSRGVIDNDENVIRSGADSNAVITSGSLADLVGFRKEAKAIGRPRNNKIIKEAVVAIPFTIRNGEKNFFGIPDVQIRDSLGIDRTPDDFTPEQVPLAGSSIKDMVRAMQEYVFPPQMDFLKQNRNPQFPIGSFAHVMYIFEFTHTLSQQDIIDIWQNLPPKR